jgi:O-antigen ligase
VVIRPVNSLERSTVEASSVEGEMKPAPPLHPHHSALQVFLEMGVAGLALVATALALLLRRLRAALPARHPAQAAVYATVIAYLGAGFSSFSIWQNWWVALPWILLLLWQRLIPQVTQRHAHYL